MLVALSATVTLVSHLNAAPAPQAAGTLRTNKNVYKPGETVVFTLTNTSPEPMTYPSISYYPVVVREETNGKETVVRELPAIVLDALGVIEPGDAKTWEWDQREYHTWYDERDPRVEGKQVPSGRYFARFETMPQGEFTSPMFVVGSVSLPVEPRGKLATTWASLKRDVR
jgi:hypothetical protein